MKVATLLLLVAGITLLGFSSVQAKEFDEELNKVEDTTGCRTCWRAGLERNCCYFVIFRASYFTVTREHQDLGAPLGSSLTSSILVNDFGFLRKVDSKRAVGGSFTMVSNDDATKFGLRLHYRQWLNQRASFNFSTGLLFPGKETRGVENGTGVQLWLGLDYRNTISLDLMFERIGYDYTEQVWHSNGIDYDAVDRHKDLSTFYIGLSGNGWLAPVVLLVWAAPLLSWSGNVGF